MVNKIKIGIEKILTISASEYVATQSKTLTDYIPIGVHKFGNRAAESESIASFLLEKVPDNTEVIVDYKEQVDDFCYSIYGTALVPKTKKDKVKVNTQSWFINNN